MIIQLKTNDQIIKEWLEELRVDLIAKYNELGLKASGNYEKELKAENTDKKAVMIAPRYAEMMEIGRRPGTAPPRSAIEKWIDDKGLKYDIPKSSLAFLIQRKIKRDGIKVPNKYNAGGVISSVITEDRINALINKLTFVQVGKITNEIYKMFDSLKAA